MKTTCGKWLLGFAALALAGNVLAQEVATPTIVTAGTEPFFGAVEVTLECDTPGATIYYTLDGTVPSPTSTAYEGTPIVLDIGTTLILAYATADGLLDSPIASREVTVLPFRVEKPFFAPVRRQFFGEVAVSIFTITDGATIYYTLDGSTPTTDSFVFNPAVPIVLHEDTVVKAIAVLAGLTDSEVATKFYRELDIALLGNHTTLSGLSDSPNRKSYYRIFVPANTSRLSISISGGSGDCDLLVAFGRPPSTNDYDYYPAFPNNNETVLVDNPAQGEWFILLLAGPQGYQDVELNVNHTSPSSGVDEPVISPSGRFKPGPVIIEMFQTQGASIHYTLDGTEPALDSALYVGPFRVTPKLGRVTVKAKAFAVNGLTSDTVTHIYKMARRIRVGTSRILTANEGRKFHYAVITPASADRLIIGTTGGSGDCDIWVRADKFPTQKIFDFESTGSDSNEEIVIENPPAGVVYYILVRAFTDFEGVELFVDQE